MRLVQEIIISGNKVTKENIIIRELTFSKNDTLYLENIEDELKKSKENLLNTSLFNFVNISQIEVDSFYLFIFISLDERWYIWPNIIFEHADRNLATFINNKNWERLNYGVYITHNNFRGRKEKLGFKVRLGYKEQFAVYYEKPNIDRKHKHGMIIDFNYFRKHETDVRTINNKVEYFEYEKYYLWELLSYGIKYTYRPMHYNINTILLQYNQYYIHDTIAKLNPDYFGNGETNQNIFSIGYQFVRDKRDSKAYPLYGYYFDVYIRKDGFGIVNNYTSTFFKNVFSYHNAFSKSFFYSSGIKWSYSTNKNLPYHRNAALGYADFLHGFEEYVIDGPLFILSKNNIKFQLLAPRTEVLKYVPFKQFNKVHYAMYLNWFFDMGYVSDNNQSQQINSMVNKFLYSTGVGFDFVTYYDQTLRFEYSLNQFGEHGFFFHIQAPIIQKN